MNKNDVLSCKYCESTFDKKRALKKHMKIDHAGEKIFGCNYCHRKYAKRKSLKNHERLCNTVEKPYGCNLCDKKFAKSKFLKNHEKQEHIKGQLVSKCPFGVFESS